MIDVLVIGAGPTGLALAAHLQAHGASVRVVERRLAPRPSRALVMHPRTLEVLDTVGLAAPVIARGDPAATVRLHAGAREAALPLSGFRLDDTAFPYLLAIPQAVVETTLESELNARGPHVERGVELVASTESEGHVVARLRHPDGRSEHVDAAYLAGCDGVDSTVRREAGIRFPGGPYPEVLWLADVEIDGDLARDAIHGFVGRAGILFLFPQGTPTTWRLLTVRPRAAVGAVAGADDGPSRSQLQALVDQVAGGGLGVAEPRWAYAQHLRRGQARGYRAGRVVLAGDAAHSNSPAGAQGMNTGIQDAANLGWKLALVARGLADEALLDSYAAERWTVARWVRRLTDLAFVGEAGSAPPLPWLRGAIAPLALPLLDGRRVPSPLLRVVAGLVTRHRRSPAVDEGHPALRRGPHAGDRLPDTQVRVDGELWWLHRALGPARLQVLCCGDGPWDAARLAALAARAPDVVGVHRLSVHGGAGGIADPGGVALSRLGVGRCAVYLVRPDGYVAYRDGGCDLTGVEDWLARWLPGLPGQGRSDRQDLSSWTAVPP